MRRDMLLLRRSASWRLVAAAWHGLLRQETLLLEFVQHVLYYSVGIEGHVDIAVPGLHVKTPGAAPSIQYLN